MEKKKNKKKKTKKAQRKKKKKKKKEWQINGKNMGTFGPQQEHFSIQVASGRHVQRGTEKVSISIRFIPQTLGADGTELTKDLRLEP